MYEETLVLLAEILHLQRSFAGQQSRLGEGCGGTLLLRNQ